MFRGDESNFWLEVGFPEYKCPRITVLLTFILFTYFIWKFCIKDAAKVVFVYESLMGTEYLTLTVTLTPLSLFNAKYTQSIINSFLHFMAIY